ncbi:Lipase-3 domain-containing protein [Mycena kentingensis (nom. inval.)]|nr:Lipase-3 domain-containing protein [Mycena kentingensis (nom. inval.)]
MRLLLSRMEGGAISSGVEASAALTRLPTMRVSALLAAFTAAAVLVKATPAPILPQRAISTTLYDEFVLYTKYSSAAYLLFCKRPLGKTLIQDFEFGRTQGFVVRDDEREEIVVAFRGTFSLKDAVADAKIVLLPFISPGIAELINIDVHRGFLNAYNDVAEDILAAAVGEHHRYPHYRIVVTGHSLGGAIASLAAPSLKTALPHAHLKLFTFGQPRVGNAHYARYVEELIGAENIFRVVHTLDGVPTMVPRVWSYEHFATEYWQYKEPIPFITKPHETIKRCVGREDPECSASILSTGINPPHTVYFGQLMAANPLLCH